MFSNLIQAGVATSTMQGAEDLSMLLVGLISLLWFSAGMVLLSGIQEWRSQHVSSMMPVSLSREAADANINYRRAA
jgi:hypothetical protein